MSPPPPLRTELHCDLRLNHEGRIRYKREETDIPIGKMSWVGLLTRNIVLEIIPIEEIVGRVLLQKIPRKYIPLGEMSRMGLQMKQASLY